jgi:uncharacterized protein involved in cysteine biosynthesis
VLRRGSPLRRDPSLWPWAALPLLVNLVTFGLAIWAFVANLDALAAPLERALDPGEPSAWWGWAWIGPLLLLAVLVRFFLLAALAVATYFLFTVLGGVRCAVPRRVLSERVEQIVSGARARAAPRPALRAAARSVVEVQTHVVLRRSSTRDRLVRAGPRMPVAAQRALFSALFLPLDYTAYALDRRRVSFRARRRWILAKREMLGFGGFGLALFFVPGLSFLCLPWLVTSGTLLVLSSA